MEFPCLIMAAFAVLCVMTRWPLLDWDERNSRMPRSIPIPSGEQR